MEYQYVIYHQQDGFSLILLQTALKKREEEVPKRVPVNPIRVARMYLCERDGDQPKTYEEIARKFGVSKAEVCYHIGLVNRLPADFVHWLEQCEEPEALRVFTERRLRPITRMENQAEQLVCLGQLMTISGKNYPQNGESPAKSQASYNI